MNKRIAEAQAQRVAEEARRLACAVPFTEDEWHTWEPGEEEYVVPLIKKYLRTPEQAAQMFMFDITIEDALNGRVAGESAREFVYCMFAAWNAKLGTEQFG